MSKGVLVWEWVNVDEGTSEFGNRHGQKCAGANLTETVSLDPSSILNINQINNLIWKISRAKLEYEISIFI